VKVKIDNIKIAEDRFRTDFGDIEDLANSIRRVGLINPIVVDEDNNLIAGERRLRACMLMELGSIDVIRKKDVSEELAKELELEENLHRKDLTWQEEVVAMNELHRLKQQQHGKSKSGREGGWTLKDTATALGVSEATVSMDLELAGFVIAKPDIFKNIPSKKKARQVIQVVREKAVLQEIAKRQGQQAEMSAGTGGGISGATDEDRIMSEAESLLLGEDADALYQVPSTIRMINGDCIAGLQELEDESIDLGIVDPPYGIGDEMIGSGDGAKKPKFDNDPSHCLYLYANIIPELWRLLKDGTHCYLFIAAQFNETIRDMCQDVGFIVRPVPLIWVKETGRATDMDWKHASMYEAFLFLTKPPSRPLGTFTNDVFIYNRTPSNARIHPMERPMELVKRLLELSSFEGELVLDPFAGSFVVAEACLKMGRRYIGYELNEEYYGGGIARIKGA
jgi:site-specific DNA-methyltransferase (adenine-specific)